MNKFVPLISSGISGPLGVLHLPRLWQKLSLGATGQLADGYPSCGSGYDQMVLDGLGLKREAAIAFITESRPTYPQFEAWIREQPGALLDNDSIATLNNAIIGYNHADDVRQSILGANGLPDDDTAPHDAVNLNNLDDWYEFHQAVLK